MFVNGYTYNQFTLLDNETVQDLGNKILKIKHKTQFFIHRAR